MDAAKKKIEEARGGVLFIDEAYSLVQDEQDSNGIQVLTTLMYAIEEYRGEILLIMAGYKEQLDEMIRKYNPGMASRISKTVCFEPYTVEELVRIFYEMKTSNGIVRRFLLNWCVLRDIISVYDAFVELEKFGGRDTMNNKLYEIAEACCSTWISPEETELYNYVKKSVVQWLCENYGKESKTDDVSEKVISDQVRYYIRRFKEEAGIVKSTKEWAALEDAYRIVRNGLEPEDSRISEEWKGLDPGMIMHHALEAFARKQIRSLNQIERNADFVDTIVDTVIEEVMKAGVFGAYGTEQFDNKETMYDKCRNEKSFCSYFGKICRNKYSDAVKNKAKESLLSYDALKEKGFEASEEGDEEQREETARLYRRRKNDLPRELLALLGLLLQQVADGPLEDTTKNGCTYSGVYRNIGGVYAKYVPFMEESFVERDGRFELLSKEDQGVPDDKVLTPEARSGAEAAPEQMYKSISNHYARSAALMFAQIMKDNVMSLPFFWTDDFYDRIEEYEETHEGVRYCDEIRSPSTMLNNANSLNKAAIKGCRKVLEKRLAEIDAGEIDAGMLLKQLNKLLDRRE